MWSSFNFYSSHHLTNGHKCLIILFLFPFLLFWGFFWTILGIFGQCWENKFKGTVGTLTDPHVVPNEYRGEGLIPWFHI